MSKKVVAVAGIVAVLGTTTFLGYSYMTDRETVRNDFTTAKLTVKLVEPNYDGLPDANGNGVKDKAENLVQGRVITKDPRVKNNSTLKTYAFIRVTVPRGSYMTVKSAPGKETVDLFSYSVNSGWEKLEDKVVGSNHVLLYGYKTALGNTETSPSLFNSVTFADIVEGQIGEDVIQNLKVEGYGIQEKTFTSMRDAYNSFNWSQSDS